MPNILPIEDLKKRLFLFVKDQDKLPFSEFAIHATHHYYHQMLTTVQIQDEVLDIKPHPISISPIDDILTSIWKNQDKQILLRELFYHLHKLGLTFPPVWLPRLLNLIKPWPSHWLPLYRLHPQLITLLAKTNENWQYMSMAFDHQHNLIVGQPHFYPAITRRMMNFPHLTTEYIKGEFDLLSNHHKAKLLDVLALDNHPDLLSYIDDKRSHQDKVVRVTALNILLKKKYKNLYPNLIALMKPYIDSQFDDNAKPTLTNKTMGLRKDDLKSLSSKTSLVSAVLAVLDPRDLAIDTTIIPKDLSNEWLSGAVFHEDMDYFQRWMQLEPQTVLDPEAELNISAKNASQFIIHYYIETNKTLSPSFFENILKINPFFNYEDSISIWTYVKRQFEEFTFIEESYPIHYLALKIHPNAIATLLSDPFLKNSSDWNASFIKTLSLRKEIFKILYPRK